ncbi:hypothetical protein [Caudoviricetes sp.]|nr:hypothetical protein [Caudoviricetes sp.]UOF81851.1 hypothetical protein [Caudoviricetes sp.]
MCGLFGWQIPEGHDLHGNEKLQELLGVTLTEEMDRRGGDSWGAVSAAGISKGPGEAKSYASWFSHADFVWGHTRRATHGKVNMMNAHPFQHGGLILAHNGVLNNHRELNKKYNRNFAVDSQHIVAHMSENRPLSEIEGYGAVLWQRRRKPNMLYMGRLTETGSLSCCVVGGLLVVASTRSAIDSVATVLEEKVEFEYELKAGKVYFAENGQLFIAPYKDDYLSLAVPKVEISWERGNAAWWARETPPAYSYRNRQRNHGSRSTSANRGSLALSDYPIGSTAICLCSGDGSHSRVKSGPLTWTCERALSPEPNVKRASLITRVGQMFGGCKLEDFRDLSDSELEYMLKEMTGT